MVSALPTSFCQALEKIVSPGQLQWTEVHRWSYSYDNSRRHVLPAIVVLAHHAKEVYEVVALCHEFAIPLTPRGRGTGTAGGSVPVAGGVVLSLERMDKVTTFDPANRVVVVEPGITNQSLQQYVAKQGLFWPPDPTSAPFCSVGGNLAYNSAGPRAVKYGTPRDNTLGLRAVTGGGEIIRTGEYTTKGVVGYDLTRLLIGSEGTLAVITEATLRLLPLPEAQGYCQVFYRDIETATQAIVRLMNHPIMPCMLEFLDSMALELIRNHAQADLPSQANALLLVAVDGPKRSIDYLLSLAVEAAQGEGVVAVRTAQSVEEAQSFWDIRKILSPILRHIAPKKINEDVVVPVAQLPVFVAGVNRLAEKFRITIVNFGHAGNGNIHVNLLIDPKDPALLARAYACLEEIFALVLSLKGTLSGEHGVGLEKRDFVDQELDPAALAIMRRIKSQFDPRDILNPGKTLPLV